MEDIYVCKDCGSDQIREAVCVWYNTREEIRSVFDNVWCEECDCEVATVNKDEWIKAVIRKRTHELQSTYCG